MSQNNKKRNSTAYLHVQFKVYWAKEQTLHYKWVSSWDYGTYHIGDQQRLRRVCASVQSRQSLRCLHTWSMEVDEGCDQKSDIYRHSMAAHAHLKNEFMEDAKCHNFMRWLKFCFPRSFEPCHEIMTLFVLHKLILQMRLRSQPLRL